MAPAVAMKVLAAVITSSPGPTPSALSESESASVPVPTPIACRAPQRRAKRSSNSATGGPSVNWVDSSSPLMSRRMGSESANWSRRYE